MSNHYPEYQYSVFLNGDRERQVVVRAKTWAGFLKKKAKVDTLMPKKVVPVQPTQPAQPQPVKAFITGDAKCSKCGSPMAISKAGNPYCKNTCWLKK